MIEVVECKGDAKVYEMLKMVQADDKDIALIDARQRLREHQDIFESVLIEYIFSQGIAKMKKLIADSKKVDYFGGRLCKN